MRKSKKQIRSVNQKELVAETLKLPKDIMVGFSIVTLMGNHEVVIENYKGILEYTDDAIFIQCKNNKLMIEGKKLTIEYYSNEDMKIIGTISTIRYL